MHQFGFSQQRGLNRRQRRREAALNRKQNASVVSAVSRQFGETSKTLPAWRMALMGTAALGAVAFSGEETHAQAIVTPVPTANADNVNITGDFDPGQIIDTLAGNDTITSVIAIEAAGAGATVTGGADDDSIILNILSSVGFTAGESGTVLGDAGNDTITLDNSNVGFSGTGTVSGGVGNDVITGVQLVNVGFGATGVGQILGDAGEDTITISTNSNIGFGGNGTVSGGADDDSIAFLGVGNAIGFGAVSMGQVLGDGGADTITLNDTDVGFSGTGIVSGGAGNDSITVNNGSEIGNQVGSMGQILGDAGNDTIIIDDSIIGNAGAGTVSGGADDDFIALTGTTTIGAFAQVLGDSGNDTVSIDTTTNPVPGLVLDGGVGIDQVAINTLTDVMLVPGVATNFEQLAKNGPATLTVPGSQSFTDQVDVNTGILDITGTLATSNTIIDSGASVTLSGGVLANNATGAIPAGPPANTTLVSGGILTNNGTLVSAGGVNVTGGILAGEGTFTGNVTATGGTISPGNSVGTQTVNGDLTLDAGSTLLIEVTQTATDQINVNGTVTIDGGTVQFDDLAPLLTDATPTFVFINNDGTDAVQGSGFANIVDNLAFLIPEVILTGGDGNDVEVSFTAAIDLSAIAVTPNQLNSGTVFDGLDPAADGVQDILDAFLPLSVEAAQDGLDNLAGEIFGSANFATNSSGLFVGDSIIDVLNGFASVDQAAGGTEIAQNVEASVLALSLAPDETAERLYAADLALNEDDETQTAPERRRYVFSRGLFRDVQVEADGNGAETDIQNRGFIAGGGLNFNDRFSAGLGAGFLRTEVDINSLNEEVDGNGAVLNAHARFTYEGFDVTGTVGYIYTDFSSDRIVTVGALTQTASADFDAHTAYADGEIGYTTLLSGNIALRPFVGGSFSVTRRGAFTETGAGAANLSVAATTDVLGQFNAGLSASTSFNLGSALIVPRIEAAIDVLAGDVTPETTATFTAGGLSFTSTGTTPGRTRGRVSAGFATKLTKNLTGFLNYQGIFSNNDREHTVRSGLRFRF